MTIKTWNSRNSRSGLSPAFLLAGLLLGVALLPGCGQGSSSMTVSGGPQAVTFCQSVWPTWITKSNVTEGSQP